MKLIMVKEIIIVGIITSFLNYLALKLFLYWTIDWFDILMHFLGGLLIGLIVISIIRRVSERDALNKVLLSISVILAVLAIGLTWELWEVFMGFTNVLRDKGDTILDLIMDFVGGVASIFYYYFKFSE